MSEDAYAMLVFIVAYFIAGIIAEVASRVFCKLVLDDPRNKDR